MAALVQVAVLLCVAAAIGLFALLAWLLRVDRRRLSRAARDFSCTQCGVRLDEAALGRADQLRVRHMQTLRERFPHVTPRVPHMIDAECTRCGARYLFDRATRSFTRTQVRFLFEE